MSDSPDSTIDKDALAREVAGLRNLIETRMDELRSREAVDALARIGEIESRLDQPATPPRTSRVDGFLKVVNAIMPLLLLGIGYFLIDTVKFAFEERKVQVQEDQLGLSAAQAMRDLLQGLRVADVDEEVARVNALLVAGYGVHGIAPLIVDLNVGPADRRRGDAAAEALKSFLFSDQRAAVCDRLGKVIAIPRYRVEGMKRTIELLGYLNCQDFVADLENFRGSEDLQQAASDALVLLRGQSSG